MVAMDLKDTFWVTADRMCGQFSVRPKTVWVESILVLVELMLEVVMSSELRRT